MKYAVMVLFVVVAGCGGPTFTHLGNGVAVPAESIDNYASAHGVTRAQAREQLRAEIDSRRIKDHATTYGISEDEARTQLQYAADQQGRE